MSRRFKMKKQKLGGAGMKKEESLGAFMNKALEVGKRYIVFSTNGDAFSGIYKGLKYEMLLFVDEEGNKIFFNPTRIEMIKEGGNEK
jgi:hypothetical protein